MCDIDHTNGFSFFSKKTNYPQRTKSILWLLLSDFKAPLKVSRNSRNYEMSAVHCLVLCHQHPAVKVYNGKVIYGAYVNLYKSHYAKGLFICVGGHSITYVS